MKRAPDPSGPTHGPDSLFVDLAARIAGHREQVVVVTVLSVAQVVGADETPQLLDGIELRLAVHDRAPDRFGLLGLVHRVQRVATGPA